MYIPGARPAIPSVHSKVWAGKLVLKLSRIYISAGCLGFPLVDSFRHWFLGLGIRGSEV